MAGACPPRQLWNCDKYDQSPVADELSRRASDGWRTMELSAARRHTVLWTAVGMGSVLVPEELRQGELVAFKPSSAAIEFEAQSDAEFVLGSAVRMITTSFWAPTPYIQAPSAA